MDKNQYNENNVIGCCLYSLEAFNAARFALDAEDFKLELNRQIFERLTALVDEGYFVKDDVVEIFNKIKNDLGAETAYKLLEDGCFVTDADVLYRKIERIKELSNQHKLHALMKENERLITNGDLTPEESMYILQEKAKELKSCLKEEFMESYLSEVYEYISDRFENKGLAGVSTGYWKLDNVLGGLRKGELYIIGARPKMGKTSYMVNLIYNALRTTDKTIVLYSLEMAKEQILEKLIYLDAKTTLKSNGDYAKLANSLGRLRDEFEKRLIIYDSEQNSVRKMVSTLEKIKKRHGLSLVFIDYLQLIVPDKSRNNRAEEVSEISRSLKIMAKNLQVPLVALSQLSRGVEKRDDKRPIASDLRESGSLEQDAAAVLFLYRPDAYNPDSTQDVSDTELIVSLNRFGAAPVIINFAFDKPKSLFVEKR